MASVRVANEIKQLQRLKRVLDADTRLPLRFDLSSLTVEFTDFRLTIRGLTSPISSTGSADVFKTRWSLPTGYPVAFGPNICFETPIPFHPHVWTSGRICWGSLNGPQREMYLMDWFRSIVEFLQYNQDSTALIKIDSRSPANSDALSWWTQRRARIGGVVPPIDVPRLRFLIEQCRG